MTTTAERARLPRTPRHRLPGTEHRLVLACGDLAAAAAAVAVALWLWSIPAGDDLSWAFLRQRLWWLAAAGLWLLVAAMPAALPRTAFSIRRTAAVLLRGAGLLLFAYLAIYFYTPRGVLPRLMALYFLWEAVLLTLAWRVIFVAVFSAERFRRRAIIVGSGEAAATALRIMRQHRARQANVVGVLPEAANADRGVAGLTVIALEDAPAVLEQQGVSELVLAWRRRPEGALLDLLVSCQQVGIDLVRVQTLYEQALERVPVDLLDPDWLLTELADAVRTRDASWLGKRLLDIVGALAGLAVLAVLTPLISAGIAIESGRPIFYRQRRVGRAGVPLTVMKFRTMVHDAEQPGEPRWARESDPRVTRVGRVLRRLRIDEWPQLLRVLSGEMSLVGPRPEREEFVADLERQIPFYRARLMVPPGLTGWAQVNLPYADSVAGARAKLEYDLYYVKHRSALFDLRILVRTVGTVVRAVGV
jgi:exopolysaccharide biosynthesis polyprenyl glycosylphosphotransferase